MARVQLRNLCKVFPGGVNAVKNVNIEMEDGEFVVLVGPSGCGKSTTLRMIAGLEEPSSGEVYIGDRLVNDVAPKDRDIAMVFQNYALYPHMTVYRNMAFGLEMRGYKRAEIDRRVREAAEILGIGELLERRPKALSGGQRQRVAVGRAIVRHPQVFLFDEPLSNLDAKLRVQMRTEISRLHQRLKTTMVYVTHDQVEAMTMGDRIVVMHKGEVQDVNTPLGLYNAPKNRFVAGFIGSPPMNFVKGRIRAEHGALHFVSEDDHVHLAIPAEKQSALQGYMDRAVIFGVRPEDLHECVVAADDTARIEAMIDVVEPMGSETNVYFALGGAQATARLRAEALPAENAPFRFEVDMGKCHFFDPESDRKIA